MYALTITLYCTFIRPQSHGSLINEGSVHARHLHWVSQDWMFLYMQQIIAAYSVVLRLQAIFAYTGKTYRLTMNFCMPSLILVVNGNNSFALKKT